MKDEGKNDLQRKEWKRMSEKEEMEETGRDK